LSYIQAVRGAAINDREQRETAKLRRCGMLLHLFRIRPSPMKRRMIRLVLTASILAVAAPALADPCTAPVESYKPGQRITGLVRYAGDGDSLCVGPSSDPRSWVEIREAQWFAPELNEADGRQAKAVMDGLVGRRAICTVERGHNRSTRSYDRVIAACKVDGRPIGKIMAQAGIAQGGRGR